MPFKDAMPILEYSTVLLAVNLYNLDLTFRKPNKIGSLVERINLSKGGSEIGQYLIMVPEGQKEAEILFVEKFSNQVQPNAS